MSEHDSKEIDKKLIFTDALEQYRPDQIEVTNETFGLEDGNLAYLVNIYNEGEDDYGYPERYLVESECYYATVVDGAVYGNVELSAVVWEYTNPMRAVEGKVA